MINIFKKPLFFIISGMMVLVVASVAVFIYMTHSEDKTSQNATDESINNTNKIIDYSQRASIQVLEGNYDAAQSVYDEGLKIESSIKLKADLYLGKASTAYEAAKYDDAYSFATQSYQLEPSFAASDSIAQSAELTGKLAEALNYYKIALSKVPEDSPDTPYIKDRLNSKIQELEPKQ